MAADIPRDEAMKQAIEWSLAGFDVYFKFTCTTCKTRCTLREPNTLYEYGECYLCGHETKLDYVGFLALAEGIGL